MEGADAELEHDGRLPSGEVYGIHGWETLTVMDTDFMLKTLDYIKAFEDGTF